MPAMGPTREKYEKAMKSFNASVNLYTAWMEFMVNYQGVFMEAMRRMKEKMPAELEGEIGPEKYKDFYKLWIETFSDTFKEFQKSGHFASDMGTLMSYIIDFQKINRELLEDNLLKPMNLPTRTEIDEINRDVYSLKKAVKDLAKQVKELSGREDIGQL
jgi:class III poly(R)-hydroxyalkanoic acid synthase PhaE subunit